MSARPSEIFRALRIGQPFAQDVTAQYDMTQTRTRGNLEDSLQDMLLRAMNARHNGKKALVSGPFCCTAVARPAGIVAAFSRSSGSLIQPDQHRHRRPPEATGHARQRRANQAGPRRGGAAAVGPDQGPDQYPSFAREDRTTRWDLSQRFAPPFSAASLAASLLALRPPPAPPKLMIL